MLSPEQLDRFAQNPRIIRNRQKVLTVQHNAHFILDTAREHGSFGKFISKWPGDDLIGLFELMKKRGARLGGMAHALGYLIPHPKHWLHEQAPRREQGLRIYFFLKFTFQVNDSVMWWLGHARARGQGVECPLCE